MTTAIAYLKSLGGSIVDSYTGPKTPPVVFPPPSWEINDDDKKSTVIISDSDQLPSEPPISLAKRIAILIDSLPSAVSTSLTPSSSQAPPIQDEGKQGSPVPAELDQDLARMLASEEIMNGQPTKSDSKGKNTSQHTSNIWNILASLKSTIVKDPETPPPRAVEEDQRGVMVYTPLEPTKDSKLELAVSETLVEQVDDPVPSTCTKQGSNASSIPTSPTPTPHKEKHKWVPSTTELSVLATWWGYRLYLPPPVMAKLNGTSLQATARAAMLTAALKWFLDKIPLMLIPIQFRPAVKMMKTLTPIVGYVGVFIAWSWDRVKSLDKGNGVVLTATWLLPVALLPLPWDAGDIYGPQVEEDAGPSKSNGTETKKANDDTGKQKEAKKKTIFPW